MLELNPLEICENLQDTEKRTRQMQLNDLLQYFKESEPLNEELIKLYDECYLHILKCYSDKYENIRETACNVVSIAITKLPTNDYYLQYVVSTIASRLGKKEIIEQSEEMRLEFLKQLNFLINYYRKEDEDRDQPNDLILKSYNDIIDILLKTLTDTYPAIQKEACNIITLLAKATPSFHYRCETLANPIFPILHHKHSQNRIAALQALCWVCMFTYSNGDKLSEIIMSVSPLLMDTMPLVRLECAKIGCIWLLDLKDRYSFFERILPLVLCGLKDDSPEVREYTEKEWKICGKQYYNENEAELNKQEIIDIKPINYPDNVERPTIGCRALVQRALRVVQIIMRESSDWKAEVRMHSLKLLYMFILHTEDKITAKFFEIYPDLARACAESEKVIANQALKVADLMGRLLKYEDWINHGIEGLQKHCKLGHLKCFYGIYQSSLSCNIKDIQEISNIIALNEFSHNLNEEFQEYLLKLCNVLYEKLSKANTPKLTEQSGMEAAMENLTLNLEQKDSIERKLYIAIVKVMTLSFDYPEKTIYENGKMILLKLIENDESLLHSLHGKYVNDVLATLDTLDAELDESMEPILILYGLIRMCGFQIEYLENLKKCILIVWKSALPDGKIKIFTAISIAMLKWGETMQIIDQEENIILLKKFLDEIVICHVEWKAGASSEAMRSLAVATLCSATQGAKDEAPKILPNYIKYFSNLIDDQNVATRCYVLRCFLNFGEAPVENYRIIAYKILERIDDPCAEIREWCVRVIPLLNPIITDSDSNLWNDFIKHAFKMLFIHFDGPELKLKTIIKDSLVTLGKKYPDTFVQKYQEIFINFSNKQELIELQLEVMQ